MALDSVTCGQCGAPFTYERKAAARKYCSERCKANANGNPYRGHVRRCACGSTEVTSPVGKPVCHDCRLIGRDRQGYNRRRRLVRGLVCQDCNLLLAYAHDSVERLAKAEKYLQVNRAKRGRARLEVVTDGP